MGINLSGLGAIERGTDFVLQWEPSRENKSRSVEAEDEGKE
jgi:hypothetical protein